jgi:glycosyltransferase involved in cell wall biosynthesis
VKPIRILVDSFADADEFNAQMVNGREIVARLDADRFHVTMFLCGEPDRRLAQRPNTRFIPLAPHGQTVRILREFICGRHQLVFYIKASPASRLYLALRPKWLDRRRVIGTIESQSDLYNEATIKASQIHLWERTILRSDVLFSNSTSVRASLEREYGLASEVIPTGVDTNYFTPGWKRPPNQRLRVLFVGSLRPFKGPQLLVRAASRFPQADFVIVGDGLMASELRSQVEREHLTNCELVGKLNHSDLLQQYRTADIFLFPSCWEGSPKVILEAAACGLPVIARGDYGPETVVDGKSGYLGKSDDELLDRLGDLLGNNDLRRTMGRASRGLSERFDWNMIVPLWEDAFTREATSQGRRS